MFTGFAHSQLTSLLWPKVGIAPNTLTAGNTVNTYSVSPQPAAGIDSWDGGNTLYNNMLLVINVASATAGTLTVTLRDDDAAITTANGDANTTLVATLATITAAGLYYAEFRFTHVFAATTTRVVASADNQVVRRYHSIRAVAAGGDYVFDALCIYGFNSRNFPVQDATAKAITWATT